MILRPEQEGDNTALADSAVIAAPLDGDAADFFELPLKPVAPDKRRDRLWRLLPAAPEGNFRVGDMLRHAASLFARPCDRQNPLALFHGIAATEKYRIKSYLFLKLYASQKNKNKAALIRPRCRQFFLIGFSYSCQSMLQKYEIAALTLAMTALPNPS